MTGVEIEFIGHLLFGMFFVVLPLVLLALLYVAIMEFIDDVTE